MLKTGVSIQVQTFTRVSVTISYLYLICLKTKRFSAKFSEIEWKLHLNSNLSGVPLQNNMNEKSVKMCLVIGILTLMTRE